MKNLYKCFLICFALFVMWFMEDINARAIDYSDACGEEINGYNEVLHRCGTNYIYVGEDRHKSSFFTSSIFLYDTKQTIYAGKVDGIDTFYVREFQYFSVVYDDRGMFTSDENRWSDITLNGALIYTSKFKDNALVDQSKNHKPVLYQRVGTYMIRQYVGSTLTNVTHVIIPERSEYGGRIARLKYGSREIGVDTLYGRNSNLSIGFAPNDFGYGDYVNVKVNSCDIRVFFAHTINIDNSEFRDCLKYNTNNTLQINITNGFDEKQTFKYSFILLSNDVSINLESTMTAIETTSRRIVIKATAGQGKKLQEEYNLYYWSKNPNDSLSIDDFLKNFDSSKYKGSYSEGRGVILRDTVGTYYLYALAKDDDSTIVVRSDEYVLKKKEQLNDIIWKDFIFVGGLCILAILPIIIYLGIRGKDTD